MDRFEDELGQALQRVEAPLGFAGRVMARVPRARMPAGNVRRWPVALTWSLAAALLAGVGLGAEVRHQRQQRAAEQQFNTAMRVTDRALEQTREQLSRAGWRLSE